MNGLSNTDKILDLVGNRRISTRPETVDIRHAMLQQQEMVVEEVFAVASRSTWRHQTLTIIKGGPVCVCSVCGGGFLFCALAVTSSIPIHLI